MQLLLNFQHRERPYCNGCYQRLFGPDGYRPGSIEPRKVLRKAAESGDISAAERSAYTCAYGWLVHNVIYIPWHLKYNQVQSNPRLSRAPLTSSKHLSVQICKKLGKSRESILDVRLCLLQKLSITCHITDLLNKF